MGVRGKIGSVLLPNLVIGQGAVGVVTGGAGRCRTASNAARWVVHRPDDAAESAPKRRRKARSGFTSSGRTGTSYGDRKRNKVVLNDMGSTTNPTSRLSDEVSSRHLLRSGSGWCWWG
ncbi:hypothetical protein Ato02nite_019410 [Paractinoplanes toevensis]|uniref:Uncharacterized protein n=1 Tax=Paractinoplanes toevensis TaxID=571911 RepID=A0A919T788_9ACTN|nr:hypothetical protein Ato02nite_019410 [Actinoplanes toevensis]